MRVGDNEYTTQDYRYINNQYNDMNSEDLIHKVATGNLLATISFWLSLMGCMCCGVTSLVSLILAIISLRYPFTSHRGRAKLALIIDIISIIFSIVMLVISII
ncbi:MAG: hypothetical protein J6A59_10635 [Lachnospiraceae bacterium]|nr:hypothetical protein [Lachnospiraceae bacterium]